jgi:hypothetical protein
MTPIQYLPPGTAFGIGMYAANVKCSSSKKCRKNNFVEDEGNEMQDSSTSVWRAVITQALQDTKSNSRKPEDIRAKTEAINWLSGGEDFCTVCSLAGLDPDYTVNAVKRALKNGFELRERRKRTESCDEQ